MATSLLANLVSTLLLCVLVAASYSEADITCGLVSSSIAPCLPYLEGTGPRTSGCCSGVAALNSLAKTASDRQDACNCLKEHAGSLIGINFGVAAALPGQCNVDLPYPISLEVDCNKVL